MSRPTGLALCGLALLLTACKTGDTDSLAVSDAYAYAPMTDDGPGVAYFTLTNPGDAPLTVTGFTSSCFAQAALHRSVIEDGIARMLAVNDLNVAPGAAVRLSPSGLHLMLMEPQVAVAPGSRCDVQISYGNDQTLAFDIELLDRAQYRPAEPVK